MCGLVSDCLTININAKYEEREHLGYLYVDGLIALEFA
jgi:hypothetical protein